MGLFSRLRSPGRPSSNGQDSAAATAEREALQLIDEGNVLEEARRTAEALELYDAAIRLAPALARAHLNRGNALVELGNTAGALQAYAEAIARDPGYAGAWYNMGNAHLRSGQHDAALDAYRKALALKPEFVDAEVASGYVLDELGRPAEAIECYRRALKINPEYAEVHGNLANSLRGLGQRDEAVASYRRALAINPDLGDVHRSLGNVQADLAQFDEAVASYREALRSNPNDRDVLMSLGASLQRIGHFDDVVVTYRRVLDINSRDVSAHVNLGIALKELGHLDDAVASYRRALEIAPDYAAAHSNLGDALQELGQLDEAVASYCRALTIKPDLAEAHSNLGVALSSLTRHVEALASFDQALAIQPNFSAALQNRSSALAYVGRYEDAGKDLERALELTPDLPFADGSLWYSRMRLCDWRNYEEASTRLLADVRAGKRSAEPVIVLGASDVPQDQLRCARTWVDKLAPPSFRFDGKGGGRYHHNRIRLAYVSPDFRAHPVTYLMAELFERHDTERFETIAVSLGPEDSSAIRSRLRAAFSRFIDVRHKCDREVAYLLRELEVDIAVDLAGFTAHSRPGIFAFRPAPVQVNYLGFPGTMGADYMDYILADRFVIPEEQRTHYSEHVVCLPDTFQANDATRPITNVTPSRAAVGLPQEGFVFCSFNNNYKITPAIFTVWMRLLRQIPRSVLWLFGSNESVAANLRKEAQLRGVASANLVFTPRLPYADYLAQYRLADLFLDTLPFNGGTTASDALWAGLPVLTCAGASLASRMAGSLLQAIGLSEMITYSLDEYESLALRLATDGPCLSAIRQRLARNRASFPLFDTDRFRHHIEAAYIGMWERNQLGLPPASFAVTPIV